MIVDEAPPKKESKADGNNIFIFTVRVVRPPTKILCKLLNEILNCQQLF